MFSLKATTRKNLGNKTNKLREQGILPAILYGDGIKNISVQVNEKEFENVYKSAGQSSLLSLEVEDKKYDVLIHQTAHDPVTDKFLHIDFFKPSMKKKIEAEVPLSFENIAPAVKDLSGVLVKELLSVHVKALAHNLPREIKVDISVLKTFEDRIFIKDLKVAEGVEILREPDEIVANVTEPRQEKEPEPEITTEEEKKEGEEEKKEEQSKQEENREGKADEK